MMTNRATRTVLVLCALLAATFAAAQTGNANFSKFVAIGDSLTAGFTNGGLGLPTQAYSVPTLIYQQVSGSTGGFEQPWISEPGIPNQLQLESLSPLTIVPKPGTASLLNALLGRPYDNLGIPGADVGDINTPFDQLTPEQQTMSLFPVVLRPQAFGLTTTMLVQALFLQPTFVSVWVGNNDALGAATSGDTSGLTPLQDFDDDYTAMMDALIASGAQLVVANVPDVTAIPFVTTLPSSIVGPTTGQLVALVGDETPTRSLDATDRVLLSAQAVLELGCGIPFPDGFANAPMGAPFPDECSLAMGTADTDGALPKQFYLDAAELATIQQRIRDFNAVIAREASRAGAPVVDIFSILNRINAEGLVVGGIEFGTDFLAGGLFGYDGVHPAPMGYAIVANEFLREINAHYGASLQLVDLRPFVFGGAGTGGNYQVPAAMAAGARLSGEALRNLYVGLGLASFDGTYSVPVLEPDPPRTRRSLRPEAPRGIDRKGGRQTRDRRGR